MSVLATFLANAAEEGRNVILSMLVVGLIFVAVILLGDLNDWRAPSPSPPASPLLGTKPPRGSQGRSSG